MMWSLSFVQVSREWLWENEVFHLRWGSNLFLNGMKLPFFSGEVVSVYPLTDRNYVFKS